MIGFCSDCNSEHVNPGCGLTWIERIRSQTVDPSWMPAKELKNYYDKESLDDLFGGKTEDERYDQLMEETQGVGTASAEEIDQHSDLAAAHYLDV